MRGAVLVWMDAWSHGCSDVALTYAVMAGPHASNRASLHQPVPHVAGVADTQDLRDIKVGVFWEWFNDAEPNVVAACKQQLQQLQSRGAKVGWCANISFSDARCRLSSSKSRISAR